MAKADFSLKADNQDGLKSRLVLSLKGDWVVTSLPGLEARLKIALKKNQTLSLDSRDLNNLDTAGAYILARVLKDRLTGEAFSDQDSFARLFKLADQANLDIDSYNKQPDRRGHSLFADLFRGLNNIGRHMVAIGCDFRDQMIFTGHVIMVWVLSAIQPKRLRWTSLFSLMQRAGLDALPIVGVTNLFVGAVIAYLGVLQLQQFGASIFAIDLVGIAVLREFGPVIAAVLLAGRSASSFAAEIGAMKMNQEIDAMRVLGIDPYEALVLPRVLALVIMIPLISFVGAIAGLLGGAVAIWAVLGYSPSLFIQRLSDYVPFVDFFVGMVKTPVFAAMIAMIGCRMGMTVENDVISLGRNVTKAVVQSIFAIFIIDAVFSILFNEFTF
jgi:phospholipid/cholesterol/gamma-HCH transport system permease protein